MRSNIDLTKVTPYKTKRRGKRDRSGLAPSIPSNVTTEMLQARAAKMEAAEKRKREKAKKDAERIAYLLANPKQP